MFIERINSNRPKVAQQLINWLNFANQLVDFPNQLVDFPNQLVDRNQQDGVKKSTN